MHFARLLLLTTFASVLLALSMPAFAQWAWRDASGRMVYSDQPPPQSVPAKNIVRQPAAAPSVSSRADAAADAQETAAQAPPAAPSQPRSTANREIEAKLKQQQLAEAQKKAADEEARQAKIAENCERLRAYQRALDGGFRVARVNAAGQQEIMDDATRAAERERTRAEIEQQCN
jgi:hypothetical protein